MPMPEPMKNIIKQIIEDYHLPCKRISSRNLEDAGSKFQFGTPHIVYYYNMRNIGKTIYMEYDVYRNLARNVIVF